MKEVTLEDDCCDTCQRKFRMREKYYTVSVQHVDESGLETLDTRLYSACKKCWKKNPLGKTLYLK